MFNTTNTYNSFKNQPNKKLIQKNMPISKLIDVNDKELFPDLIQTGTLSHMNTTSTFKDILNNDGDDTNTITLNINNPLDIKEGQLEISIDANGNTVYKYGPPTERMIQTQRLNALKSTPHYVMDQVIMGINNNTQKYVDIYDGIHGEGSYEEKYASIIYNENYCDVDVSENDNDSETTEEEYSTTY